MKNIKNYIRCNTGFPRILKYNMNLRWRYTPNEIVVVIGENEFAGTEYYLKYDNGSNQLHYDGNTQTPIIPHPSIDYVGNIAILHCYTIFEKSSHENIRTNEYIYHIGYSSVRYNPLNPTIWEKALYYRRGEQNTLAEHRVLLEHNHSVYDLYRVVS